METKTKLTDFSEDYKEDCDLLCPRCKGKTFIEKSGKHIKWSCKTCRPSYIKFIRQKPENFIMPIGKYKGKSLEEIIQLDSEYIKWAAENINSKSISDRCKEILEKK